MNKIPLWEVFKEAEFTEKETLIDIWCDKTSKLLEEPSLIDTLTKENLSRKYSGKTFPFSYNPWKEGSYSVVCPFCDACVMVIVVKPRKVLTEQELYSNKLKDKKDRQVGCGAIGLLLIVAGFVGLYLQATLGLTILAFLFGIFLLSTAIKAHSEKIDSPRKPEIEHEVIEMSAFHEKYFGFKFSRF